MAAGGDRPALAERLLGCLVGMVAGDALGMPVAGLPRRRAAQMLRAAGEGLPLLPPPPDHPFHAGLAAGSGTDETEVLLLLLELGLEEELAPERVARALTRWARERRVLDDPTIGPSTRLALSRLLDGVPWQEAGRDGSTNGAAVRGIAGALLHPGDAREAARAAVAAALPTHGAQPATAAAAAVAGAAAVLLGGAGWPEALGTAERMARWGHRCGYPTPAPLLPVRLRWALNQARSRPGPAAVHRVQAVLGAGSAAVESIPFTLAAVAAGRGDPVRTLRWILAAGDDADSNAAFAGALLGAHLGASGLPPEMTRAAEPLRDRLVDLAQRLAQRASRASC